MTTREEERLRRHVARGAGSREIKRLLDIVERRERGHAPCDFAESRFVARVVSSAVRELRNGTGPMVCMELQIEQARGALQARGPMDLDMPLTYVAKAEGPLGVGVSLRSALSALGALPPGDVEYLDLDSVANDLVGRRALVAAYCKRTDDGRHMHFATTLAALEVPT